MVDNKKISIRLGIDGADGVKATLTAVGNDGSKALERISDAAQAIAPSLSSMTTAMREASRGISPTGASGFDSIAKSASASAQAMEAAFATEKRAMQAMLDAADPAAAALRRIAQASADADRALAHHSITEAQHATIMRSLAAGTETASRGYSRFGMIVQQAGFQLSDVAAVAASGGNVLSTVGVQLGQFVGFLGPWGAVAGIVVTAMGALAHVLLESGSAAEEAKRQQDAYNESLKAVIDLEKDYQAALRERQGFLPKNPQIETLKKGELESRTRAEGASKNLSFFEEAFAPFDRMMGWERVLTEREKADSEEKQALSDLRYALALNEGTGDEKLKTAIQKLNEERERETALMRSSASERERNRAMMEAELKTRKAFEDIPASAQEVESEIAKARSHAASVYDQKQREDAARTQTEAMQKQSEADDKATAAIEKQIAALKEHAYQLTLSDRELKIHQELLKGYESAGPKGLSLAQEQELTFAAGNDYDTEKSKKDATKAEEDRMNRMRENAQEMRQFSNQMAASMTSAFEQAVFSGNDLRGVFSGLLDDMAKMILRATVMKPLMNWLVGGDDKTGGGGFLGSVVGNIFHEGGVVGEAAPQRAVPMSVFAHAPRYHGGGIAGLLPEEVPAILKRGEVVLPRGASKQASGGSSVTIVQNNTFQIPATGSSKDNSALIQQITSQIATVTKAMVMQVLTDQKRAGGLLTA